MFLIIYILVDCAGCHIYQNLVLFAVLECFVDQLARTLIARGGGGFRRRAVGDGIQIHLRLFGQLPPASGHVAGKIGPEENNFDI